MNKLNQKIPDGWSVKKVKDLGRVVTGSTPSMACPENYGGTFCWATAQDFGSKYISDTVVKLSEQGKNCSRILPPGSVLITCIASLGLNAIAKVEMATNQQINAVIPNKENNGEFIYYQVSHNTNQLKRFAGAGGMMILTKGEFEKIPFVFPPLPEQEKIAGILGTWDEAIEKLSDLIEQKKLLKKGLMQKLLTGKTRLPTFTQPWKEVKLGNTCQICTGKKDVNEGNPQGTYPFFTCARNNTFSDTFSFDEEAILIAGNGEVGNCQYYVGKFEAYQRTYVLSDFKITGRLLFQYLSYFFKQYVDNQKQQGAMPYIKLRTLTEFQLSISSDIQEQNKILDVLSTADDEINLLNQKLEALKEQKKGLMQQLLTGQIRVKVN